MFALDGIAIVVNNENTVEDLTLEQIKGLATGEITNWSEVGGPDAPVVLVGREAAAARAMASKASWGWKMPACTSRS